MGAGTAVGAAVGAEGDAADEGAVEAPADAGTTVGAAALGESPGTLLAPGLPSLVGEPQPPRITTIPRAPSHRRLVAGRRWRPV
ncbi:MAG TPA: hypothetical protein VMQ65_03820 [Candidatus Limnocylindria bacterium]|nr:hypothetical protein [Candidatus Limnocylindria bacterium]